MRDPDFGKRRPVPDDVKERMEDAEAIAGEPGALSPDDADYMVISCRVPAEKGKWRIISRDVEDEANIGSLIVPRSSKLADEDIDECKLSTPAVSF